MRRFRRRRPTADCFVTPFLVKTKGGVPRKQGWDCTPCGVDGATDKRLLRHLIPRKDGLGEFLAKRGSVRLASTVGNGQEIASSLRSSQRRVGEFVAKMGWVFSHRKDGLGKLK